MRNIKLTIEYDGTNYHGWQIQPNRITVQETVQKALSQLTKSETPVIAAGRTDSGVHAAGQVANFHTHAQMPLIAFQKGVNAILPPDIAIAKAEAVNPEFHARFDAKGRVYRYTMLNGAYRSPFWRNHAYFFPNCVDASKIDAICQALIGKRDFSSFQRTGSDRINPVCEIYVSRCWREGDMVYLEVTADSFLRGMVRAIVGTALKLRDAPDSIHQLRTILEARDRSAAGPSASARGLSLIRVVY